MATSLAIPQSTVTSTPAKAPPAIVSILPPFTAPALFMAVCFACGDAIAQRFWLSPAHVFVALALLFTAAMIAAFRAARVAVLPATILCLILGFFCAEIQPRPPTTTPLERIAFATPTSTPSIRRLGIETAHVVDGLIIRTTPTPPHRHLRAILRRRPPRAQPGNRRSGDRGRWPTSPIARRPAHDPLRVR